MIATTSDIAKALRLLCALALLCVGFAHKTPAIETTIPFSEIAAYTLPDGTLPVVCLPSANDSGKHHGHEFGKGCEACRIAGCIDLPGPGDLVGTPFLFATELTLPIRREAFHRQLFPPSASPRGPPLDAIA